MVTTNNIDITSLVGISQLHLFIYGRNNVMRLNGIRLDICKMLDNSQRKSLVTMLYKGIMQTDNNLPKKCPFERNTTYALRNMKFDASYLPSYLPEYNFTYTGLFHANNVNSFEVRVIGSFCSINHDCTGLARHNKSVDPRN
ncbi:uncharacterized protein LOC117792432 [Drosophila innubila]|uniref:uncharacterized protein LOC117792432 n=1 Tax=Drosophila innubila TaxID=198719 RepID=UPI00148B562F|nr:uncharacterized protein LOC117792432 [Drosophila innubila]